MIHNVNKQLRLLDIMRALWPRRRGVFQRQSQEAASPPPPKFCFCSSHSQVAQPCHDSSWRCRWNSLARELGQSGTHTQRASLLLVGATLLLNSGSKPSCYALAHLLRASTDLASHLYSRQLHSYMLRCGFCSDVFVSTALIRFYANHSHSDARKVFDETPHPTVVSWNSIISAYVRCGELSKALRAFLQLNRCSHISPDPYSFTAALAASASAGTSLLPFASSIHSKILKSGLETSTVVSNCLIHMYGKCGSLEEAILAFNNTLHKDAISWNSVIGATARNGSLDQAVRFLRHMPNPDTISYNELINGIAEFGDVQESIKILSIMPNPNPSSWNSIITGHVNRNQARGALDVFCKMHSVDVAMDEFTFSSLLSGVAGLSALTWGRLIHCCTIKKGFDASTVVGCALIDMYSKCGQINKAESIFLSLAHKNLVTWNAMLSGFAHNGKSSRAIDLFGQLQMERNIEPDEITFLNVLSTCSHNPMPLERALEYLRLMIKGYGIEPTKDHCCCVIRLMAQRGELRRATGLIYELGFGASASVWRALLGACEYYMDVKVAEVAAAKVIQLEGDKGYAYNVISNIYAACGKWDHVSALRELMRVKRMRKEAAYSWIQVEKTCPKFSSLCHQT